MVWLLQFLLSDIFPEVINHKIVKPVFAVVVALLFIAPQVCVHGCAFPDELGGPLPTAMTGPL